MLQVGQQGSMVVLQAEQQLSVIILQAGAAEVDLGSSTVQALSSNSRSGIELKLLIGRQIAGILALSIIGRVAVRY